MNEERILELLNLLVNDMIEGEGHHIHNVIQNLLDLGFTRKELLALSFQEADISDACPQNTRIDYLYRDASNYKKPNMAILSGSMSGEQQRMILDCLDEGEYFIPHLVRLPEIRFDSYSMEDDHPWFELHKGAFSETAEPPTVSASAEELVKAFQARKDCWQQLLEQESKL